MSIESSVQSAYDQVASQFGDSRRTLHWPELDQEVEKVKTGSKVLDIGCGTGRLCTQLSKKKVNYTGTDISQKQLNVAMKNCAGGNFLQGTMTALPFDSESFDHIFMIASLHHLDSPEKRKQALSEAVRVLKPGGRLFITNINLWKKKYLKSFFDKQDGLNTLSEQDQKRIKFNDVFLRWSWKSEKVIHRYYHAFTKRELRSLLKGLDVTIESSEYVKNGQKVKFWQANNIVTILRKK